MSPLPCPPCHAPTPCHAKVPLAPPFSEPPVIGHDRLQRCGVSVLPPSRNQMTSRAPIAPGAGPGRRDLMALPAGIGTGQEQGTGGGSLPVRRGYSVRFSHLRLPCRESLLARYPRQDSAFAGRGRKGVRSGLLNQPGSALAALADRTCACASAQKRGGLVSREGS